MRSLFPPRLWMGSASARPASAQPAPALARRLASTTLACLSAGLLAPPPGQAQELQLQRLQDEAVTRTRAYLRVDTTNPPGHESRAVQFLGRILEDEGVPFETAESAPGRGNLWARLDGGPEPALVLLHHTDVVPADASSWSVPPFSGELRDGHIYGRGALDMKTTGILQLQAFLALHRSGRPLRRDVLYVATADEEAGGFFGAGWLIENRPELFEGAGLLLNEGGGGTLLGGRRLFAVEITQKIPYWLRLEARGRAGHGSVPAVSSAVTRLVRALDRVREQRFPPRLIPPVATYFRELAPHAPEHLAWGFERIGDSVQDPRFLMQLQLERPDLHALVRNTCSLTRLEGSPKINVVPPRAAAELDCRLLPDQDPAAFLEELRTLINDPEIDIEELMLFTPAISPTDTPLYEAIESVLRRNFPEAVITPAVSTGFTDSHFFRDLGIASYGLVPMLIPEDDRAGVHGNDERVSVENVRLGTRLMLEIVEEAVY